MKRDVRVVLGILIAGAIGALTGCSTGAGTPAPPQAVDENYPGTCMPPEFTWPTDFLEGLPSESAAVSGSVVGLRLEYLNEQWVWRIRSVSSKTDMWGERVAHHDL